MSVDLQREGDTMVITTVERRSAVIKFEDIVKKAKVESEYSDPPWKECDGYEHEAIKFNDEMEPGRYSSLAKVRKGERSRRLRLGADPEVFVEHYNRMHVCGQRHSHHLIVISDEQMEKWGVREYPHARGASKQVAFELAAENRQRTYQQLIDRYNDGWYSWVVSIDFMEYSESLCGILCDEGDDYLDEVASDLAEEIASQLESDGYTVTGKPDWKSRERKQKGLRSRIAHNLGFEDGDAYRKWITSKRKV